ncbi:hypothetical protein AGMMS50276_02680 [Synergistales bacterium]|nr:hypothetical protein AGMMS50276_02680 [Synergistales bacterium]
MAQKRISWTMVIWLVLAFATLAIAAAVLDAMVTSSVSTEAGVYELQGIQGADTTQNIATQKIARKAGKTAEEKELGMINARKVEIHRIISAAQNAQTNYYNAKSNNADTSSLRSDLERRIPEARAVLVELKTLTDRQLDILRTIGSDEGSVYIVKTFYTSMETVVNTLQLDDLTEQQLDARTKNIEIAGNGAIATAHNMARKFDANDMSEEEKAILDQEVVEPGEKAIKGMGDILSHLPQIIWVSVQGMSEGVNMLNEALNRYNKNNGGMAQMMHDLSYGQGMFNRRNMDQFQKRLDNIGAGVQKFLGTYSPFVKTVGNSIGRNADVDAMGYGDNIVIRFADPRGRLYILKEDEHMRLIADKLMTKWSDDEHEVRTMIIFEYDDQGVESVIQSINSFAPGFERYIRESRIIYCYKGYRPTVWKSFLYEMNFQNSDGQEKYHYTAQGDPKGEWIKKKSLDETILETIFAMSPPKDKSIMVKPGESQAPGAKPRDSKPRDSKPQQSKPQSSSGGARNDNVSSKPSSPSKPAALSKKGKIEPPTEGNEVIESLNVDAAAKAAIIEERAKAVENFNAGKYDLALRQFSRAAKLAGDNYLDAYWAALSAHKAKNNSALQEWLTQCLKIKNDYVPALEMKKALKLK